MANPLAATLDLWYTFLKDIHSALSTFTFQKDRFKWRDFNNWKELVDKFDDKIDTDFHYTSRLQEKIIETLLEIKYEKFLFYIIELAFKDDLEKRQVYRKFIRDMPNVAQLLELDRELELIFQSEIEQFTILDTFFVRGYCVKFSDFVNDEGNLKNSANIRNVVIFAMTKVFIDRDLNGAGKNLRVFIIAPNWFVINGQEINLSGGNAKNYTDAADTGLNGLPGLPGGHGGDFFGIAKNIVNGKYLQINVNGGTGGKGQLGGDGKDAQNQTPPKDLSNIECNTEIEGKKYRILESEDGHFLNFTLEGRLDRNSITVDNTTENTCILRVYTSEETFATDGGHGGAGGSGGNSGKVIFILQNGDNEVQVSEAKGEEGQGGLGGFGGRPKFIRKDTYEKPINSLDTPWKHLNERTIELNRGRNGTHGFNMESSKLPEQSKDISRSVYIFINEYKTYVQNQTQNHRVVRDSVIEFLKDLSEYTDAKKLFNKFGSVEILKDFGKNATLIDEAKTWYTFLSDAYSFLTEYRFQKDTTKYDVKSLDDWGSTGERGLVVSKENVEAFLEKIYENDYETRYIVRMFKFTPSRLKELNEVIETSLRAKIQRDLNSETLTVEGLIVKFSDIVDDEGKLTDIKDHPSKLVIIALKKLFIDKDFYSPEKLLNITIIAPEWHVIGVREINLAGENGMMLHSPEIASQAEDGKPGYSGKSGRNYFGVVKEIIGGGNLTINVSGGKGGRGQHGGVGKDGGIEVYAELAGRSNPPCSLELCYNDGEKKISANTTVADIRDFDCWRTEKMSNESPPWEASYDRICQIYVNGTSGSDGGIGGNGGVGGMGGLPGNVILIPTEKRKRIQVKMNIGERGIGGYAGEGGKRGSRGGVKKFYRKKVVNAINNKPWVDQGWLMYPSVSSRGSPGKDDSNGVDKQEPEKAQSISNDFYVYINRYKSLARNYLNCSFLENSLMDFLKYFNENQEVNDLYNTIGLANEMEELEEDIIRENVVSIDNRVESSSEHKIDYVPFYEVFLERIQNHTKKISEIENVREHKQILNYAYANALSKIYNLKNYSRRNLVSDVVSFLNYVKDSFESLNIEKDEFISTFRTLKAIDDYRSETMVQLEGKIKEATEFVENIKPELHGMDEKLDEETDKLIKEIKALEVQSFKDIEKATEYQNALESLVGVKVLFGMVRIAATAANAFGPIGAAIGQVVITGTDVIESSLEPEEYSQIPIKLPKNVESISGLVKVIKTERLKNLEEALKKFKEENSEAEEGVLQDISVEAERVENSLENVDQIEEIENQENDFKRTLEKKEQELKKEGKKFDKALEIIGKVKTYIEIGKSAADFFFKLKKDEKKIAEAGGKVALAKEKFKELRIYEQQIYKELQPAFDETKKYLDSTVKTLGGKSRASLQVAKFKVKTCLEDVKIGIKKQTEGRKVSGPLQHIIDRYQEIMNTLMSMYDFIEHYQEGKMTINFIANVAGAAAIKGQFHDSELGKAGTSLELAIISNLLLKQYRTAIEAFKQFTFPFTGHFFIEKKLPAELTLAEYPGRIISDASDRIKKLIGKIREQTPYGGRFQQCLWQGPFTREIEGVGSFYKWSNETYNSTIADLLKGKEIMLFANVVKSREGLDAIKFNEISIEFTAIDKSLQSKLYEDLKEFALIMSHTGDSYYRYNNKIYRISTDQQVLSYNLQKIDGKYVHLGVNNINIRNGNFVLSPFTLWKLKLEPLKDRSNFLAPPKSKDPEKFSDMFELDSNSTEKANFTTSSEADKKWYAVLQPYINKIDLYLEGTARYVLEDHDCIDPDVPNYYEVIGEVKNSKIAFNNSSVNKIPEGHTSLLLSSRRRRNVSQQIIDTKYADSTVDKMHQHTTNSASSFISSPINIVFNWLRERSIIFLASTSTLLHLPYITMQYIFKHKDDDYYDALETDIYYDASETLEPDLERSAHTMRNVDFSKPNPVLMSGSNPISVNNENITLPYYNHLLIEGKTNFTLQLPLIEKRSINFAQSPNFEGNRLLMLADFLCRSYSGEKYKQAKPLCPMQEEALKMHELKEKVFTAFTEFELSYM